MNKTLIFLIISTCIVILSVAIIVVGPITNKVIGKDWGRLNCDLLADQMKLLKNDITKLKKMKNLCNRQKSFHDMEYTSFIINIILGFLCADLALIHYLGYGKDFEVKTGIIGLIAGIIGFVLTLVYVCYSGYIFTKDIAYLELDINQSSDFIMNNCIKKLYSNGASYQFVEDPDNSPQGNFITEYENDRDDFSNYIKYKDLGKSRYNYDSKYYKKYNNYDNNQPEENKCSIVQYKSQNSNADIPSGLASKFGDCEYIYEEPIEKINNKDLFDRWVSALILACFVLVSNLALAMFGLFLCSNFGQSI